MDKLNIGVLASTHKKHEKRAPLHPAHLPLIDAEIRSRMFLETGYGTWFGYSDEQLARSSPGYFPAATSSASATWSSCSRPLPAISQS